VEVALWWLVQLGVQLTGRGTHFSCNTHIIMVSPTGTLQNMDSGLDHGLDSELNNGLDNRTRFLIVRVKGYSAGVMMFLVL